MRRLYLKPSMAETVRQNQKALDHMALLAGSDLRIDLGAKPKQERAPVDTAASESPVLSAVGYLLSWHPRVAIALRMNSGGVHTEDERGETRSVLKFHRFVRGSGKGPLELRVTDFAGILVTGMPFAIECKKPGWRGVSRGSSDTALREQAQERYIQRVIALGGLAGFARSVDEAQRIIEQWGG